MDDSFQRVMLAVVSFAGVLLVAILINAGRKQ
jgi:hypothetical protein